MIQEQARNFSLEKLEPFSLEWDKTGHFPIDIIKEGGLLGFGAVSISEDYGGIGLGAFETSLIIEALGIGNVPISSYFSIHNMNCGVLDKYNIYFFNFLNEISNFSLFLYYFFAKKLIN